MLIAPAGSPFYRLQGTAPAGQRCPAFIDQVTLFDNNPDFQGDRRYTIYQSVIDLLRDPSTRDLPLYGTGPMLEAAVVPSGSILTAKVSTGCSPPRL